MRALDAKCRELNANFAGRRAASAPLACGHPAACQTRTRESLFERVVECAWCAEIQAIVDAVAAAGLREASEVVWRAVGAHHKHEQDSSACRSRSDASPGTPPALHGGAPGSGRITIRNYSSDDGRREAA